MGLGRPSMSDSPAGRRKEPGPVCSKRSRSRTTSLGRWSGRCRSTPRSAGPISTPPAPVKGGGARGGTGRSGRSVGQPGARPIPRWSDHQDPPRLRRPGLAPGRRRHDRQRQRLHRLRHGHGRAEGAPSRGRATPPQARRGHCGQGVLVPRDPPVPATQNHPGGDPGAGGPDGQPPAARAGWRQAAYLRPRTLQGPQRGGTLLQSPEAIRAIATRLDKLESRYRAGVQLASLILWLREPEGESVSAVGQLEDKCGSWDSLRFQPGPEFRFLSRRDGHPQRGPRVAGAEDHPVPSPALGVNR